MHTTKIKICGIASFEDASACIRAGADYLGFNFYPPSPRYVTPETVKSILDRLRMEGLQRVNPVGVFVNSPVAEIRRIAALCGIDIVQLHGSETPEDIASLKGFLRIKAIKIEGPGSVLQMDAFGADAYLADAPHPHLAGGTGQSYDYSLVAEAARKHCFFLAGGLTPGNVAEAIRLARPFAVDVASGVECAPGKKDLQKVEAFCQAAHSA